jgi:hypothetical protein
MKVRLVATCPDALPLWCNGKEMNQRPERTTTEIIFGSPHLSRPVLCLRLMKGFSSGDPKYLVPGGNTN